MRVSVVLCTYSPEMYNHFHEAAESVLSQTHEEVELVVIVDGSSEVFERAQQDLSPRDDVVLHQNEQNKGLLESRNLGAELSSGQVIAFLDDDAIADDQWIESIVETYEEFDAISVGGRMIPNWIDGKANFLPEEFYWLVGVTHRGFPEDQTEVRNTFGSNISFLREIFLDLGGFDTDMGGRKGETNLQGGETEFCARMRAEYGRGVVYNPDAIVSHKVFEYRTRFFWLIDRAFWQGFSKRTMDRMLPESNTEEVQFFGRILFEFVPARVARLIRQPSFVRVAQLCMLILLTTTVGLGYLYGILRWPSINVE